jgi:hypothetical protein
MLAEWASPEFLKKRFSKFLYFLNSFTFAIPNEKGVVLFYQNQAPL